MGTSGSLEVPTNLHRRSPGGGRHCHRHLGLRVAAQGRHELQGPLPVSRREDAVVQRRYATGLLPLLRLRRRRRRLQVRRAAGQGQLPAKRCATSPARFGIPIPEVEASGEQRETAAEREALVKIHEIALAYFREQLASPAGARWREYLLKDRGLTQETIDQLQIGWAPPSRDALRQRLLKEGFTPAAARDERPGLAPRRWQRDRSVSQPPDDPDRARHRHGDRVRRPRARSRSAAEIPELARDADLYEEPHALRPQPDEGPPSARATSR